MAKVQLQLFEKRERKIAGWVVRACGGVSRFCALGCFSKKRRLEAIGRLL